MVDEVVQLKTKDKPSNTDETSVHSEMEETPKPTIDPESPSCKRPNHIRKKILKPDAKEYRTLKKFREKQQALLGDDDIEDPDPFHPTYVFYCFTGTLKD